MANKDTPFSRCYFKKIEFLRFSRKKPKQLLHNLRKNLTFAVKTRKCECPRLLQNNEFGTLENNGLNFSFLIYISIMLGTTEIIIIAAVILLLFGGSQIPKLMRGIGQGVNAYKKGLAGEEDEDEKKATNSAPQQSKEEAAE